MADNKLVSIHEQIGEKLSIVLHRTLRNWNKSGQIKSEIFGLPLKDLLQNGMLSLEKINPFNADLLARRFFDGQTILAVAHHYHYSQDQINRRQKEAIEELSRIIKVQLASRRSSHAEKIINALQPPSYENLFGVNNLYERLSSLIYSLDGPWVIALLGLGGIGKTALLDSFLRQNASALPFDELLWIRNEPTMAEVTSESARQRWTRLLEKISQKIFAEIVPSSQLEEEIRHHLSTRPHLLVVDNLEEELSHSSLINRFRSLANPSKVILTSRARPKSSSNIHQLLIPELDESSSTQLLLHQAKLIGIGSMEAELKEKAVEIYKVTGGNPLALRLVVGLLAALPLEAVLESLIGHPLDDVEEMYRFIFQKSWLALSVDAQKLLQAMPLVASRGATWEHMQAISGVASPQLNSLVRELVSRSLMELHGSMADPLYGIHRLTESFLETEIIAWI